MAQKASAEMLSDELSAFAVKIATAAA